MSKRIILEIANRTFGDVIGIDKQYIVPQYQRDYSWGVEQWSDLWEDLMELQSQHQNDREPHYMGHLVLQQLSANTYTIIDGQQRITTLTLLILAGLQILKASSDEDDKQRSEIIKRMFINTINTGQLTLSYKLQLNRNNNAYYRENLVNLSDQLVADNIKKSENLMRTAKAFFEEKIKNKEWSGKEFGAFAETVIMQNLLFTVTKVEDDTSAYKIFQTLNAKGLQHSIPDLLKNYLFSVIDPSGDNESMIDEQEKKWAEILQWLDSEDFSGFLRMFLSSKNIVVTRHQLYKNLKDSISTSGEAIAFLDELYKAVCSGLAK